MKIKTKTKDIKLKMKSINSKAPATCNLTITINASREKVWAVMTDYDHAVEFVSDLEFSRIVKHEDNVMHVLQRGKTSFGPFSFPVEIERKIQLTPFEKMESRMTRGTMKKLEGTTTLKAEGAGTRITNRTESIPNVWLPPLVGRLLVKRETRAKFQELRVEILRRKKVSRDR